MKTKYTYIVSCCQNDSQRLTVPIFKNPKTLTFLNLYEQFYFSLCVNLFNINKLKNVTFCQLKLFNLKCNINEPFSEPLKESQPYGSFFKKSKTVNFYQPKSHNVNQNAENEGYHQPPPERAVPVRAGVFT